MLKSEERGILRIERFCLVRAQGFFYVHVNGFIRHGDEKVKPGLCKMEVKREQAQFSKELPKSQLFSSTSLVKLKKGKKKKKDCRNV